MYNILLVDDEIFALEGLKTMIDWKLYHIEAPLTATSMKQAITIIQNKEIHILICDIQMPNGSGLDLLAWINDHYPEIVTILLTFHEKFEYVKKALSLGAFDYLLKPASEEELQSALRHCIKRAEDIQTAKENQRKLQKLESKQTFSHIPQEEEEDSKEHTDSAVSKAIRYINQNLDKDLTRKEICEHVYVHQDYLSKIFRKDTGMTISEYIFDKRMELAQKLLRDTDESIGMICMKTGYSFNSHFSKMFKMKTGVSPQQYRNSISAD